MIKNSTVATENSILLRGYQKKLKTMKKKFFVLFSESSSNSARLEYFDSEKKFNSGCLAKRTIKLKNCFNINRRLDTKYDYVIGLSTKEGGFGIVLETEEEMAKWLETLITLQRNEQSLSEKAAIPFDHVWQVMIQRKGMALEKGMFGNYHVGLTPKSLTFIKIASQKQSENRIQNIEFLLTTIRRCGDSQCVFYMELGRQSLIGPGELWMETEDALTARNMHNMILSAMSSKTDMCPGPSPMRKRSSSANEASKPKSLMCSTDLQVGREPSCQNSVWYGRERCESLPSSRNRNANDYRNRSVVSLTNQLRNSSLQINHTGHFKNEKTIPTIEDQDDDRERTHLLQSPLSQDQGVRSSSTGSRDDYRKSKVFSDSEEDFRRTVRTFSAGSQGILPCRNLHYNLTDCRSRITAGLSSSINNAKKSSHELINDHFTTNIGSFVNENESSLNSISDLDLPKPSYSRKDSEDSCSDSENISHIKHLQITNKTKIDMIGKYISENDSFHEISENAYLEMKPVSQLSSNSKPIEINNTTYDEQVNASMSAPPTQTSSAKNKEICKPNESAAHPQCRSISIFHLNAFQPDDKQNIIFYDILYFPLANPDHIKNYAFLYELDFDVPQKHLHVATKLFQQYLRSCKDRCIIWNQNQLGPDQENYRLERNEIFIDNNRGIILSSHYDSEQVKETLQSTHQCMKHNSDENLFRTNDDYGKFNKIFGSTTKKNHSRYGNFKIQSHNQSPQQLDSRLSYNTESNTLMLTNGEFMPLTATRMSIPGECLLQNLSLKHKNSIPMSRSYILNEYPYNCRIKPINNDSEVVSKNSSDNPASISGNCLYYASLDLNYCSFNKNTSTEMDAKNLNARTLCTYPPVENDSTNPAYAKISFINPE